MYENLRCNSSLRVQIDDEKEPHRLFFLMLTEDARYNTIVLAVVFSCRGHELEAVNMVGDRIHPDSPLFCLKP